MATVCVITGSSRIACVGPLAQVVCDDLAALPDHDELPAGQQWWITGGQRGVDVVALGYLLATRQRDYHEVWLPAKRHDDAAVAEILQQHRSAVYAAGGRVRVHTCLPGTDYSYRNLCMLQQAYELQARGYGAHVWAYPLHPEGDQRSKYSGTWKCQRQARTAGLEIRVRPLWL